MSRCHSVAIVIALLTVYLPLQSYGAEPSALLDSFGRTQIMVNTSNDCIKFDVYVANTSKQRAQGLMFIRSMGANEGMIFAYDSAAEISMWMKNTLISLDMLFFDAQLKIVSIHKNATPESTDIISSNAVVNGVIELNGGSADRMGISIGDQIVIPTD